MTADLFDTREPAGLALASDVLTADEEDALIARMNDAGLAPFRFGPWSGNRLTLSYGFAYDFEANRPVVADPVPDWLLPVRAKVAARFGMADEAMVQVLLSRYDPGAGIGWHRDRPIYDQVVGLSLGAPAVMRFRRRRGDGGFDRATLPLVPRSAYHLRGEVREAWQHGIVPMEGATRWSVTFRTRR